MKHLVACLAATAALAFTPVTTGIMPDPACNAVMTQAIPAVKTAFSPVADILASVFGAFCTPSTPAPGSVAQAPSASGGLSS